VKDVDMSENGRSTDTIFAQAIEIESAAARAAFLEGACGKDRELRQEVEELVRNHFRAGDFMERPAALAATIAQALTERPGTVIGPYKLMEQIGEGGMGLVFVAEQQQPLRRKVALKVIKPGMDTRQVVARFEAERQALALMDHPNIARVLDGGETGSGRPYFVMELVKGVPITEHCDQQQLSIRERLALFVEVCAAVQHAHQKGIIHRDLKPSNVLVVSHDGRPLVKVIDFGVAKAVGQQLTDKTVYTHFAQLIGTPLYMSPEQAGESGLDVDTRSDIYTLGVLLYELLTGTTPFDKDRLKAAGYDEMRRIIREEEPPQPSTRLSTLGQLATTISTQRKSEPKKLRRLLRGDLDWIVMKALEKDRDRRYETAGAFAGDVQRFLADEPVQACPPSAWYRFRKFARRNKAGLAVAGLIMLFVVLLASGTGWALRDRAARQAATDRAVTAALAQAETLLAEGEKQFDNPRLSQATTRLARAALEKAEELLATGAATEDLAGRVRPVREAVEAAVTESRLLVELDRIRLEQAAVKEGRFDNARAAPLYAKALGDYGIDLAAPEAAAARVRASRLREALLSALGDWSRVTKATEEQRRVQKVYQLALPADSLRPRLMAAVNARDGAALVKLAKEPAFQELLPTSLANCAERLAAVKEWAAAEWLLRAGLERYPGDFWLNHKLGILLKDGKPPRAAEAVRYLTAALALRADSPGVHLNLGTALHDNKDLDGAIRCCQAALRIDHKYAMAYNDLGYFLHEKGQINDAIACLRKAIDLNPQEFGFHNNLGLALAAKGQFDAAVAEYRVAIQLKGDCPEPYCGLGGALAGKGRRDEAVAAYREAIRLKPDWPEAHCNLGLALAAKGQLDQAIIEYRKAIASKQAFPEVYKAHNNLGNALDDKGRLEDAIAEYGEALRIQPDYSSAHNGLGNALLHKGRLDDAIAQYRQAIRFEPQFAEAHCNLGFALEQRGEFQKALQELRRGHDLGSRSPNWRDPSAEWVRQCEHLAELDTRLSGCLAGTMTPASPDERAVLARLCLIKHLNRTAVHFYEEAFVGQPQLADALSHNHRYHAACAAVLAGSGQGKDADKLDSKGRGRLRRQALDWLRADLAQWRKQMENNSTAVRTRVEGTLAHWKQDRDLASVRGGAALAKLPADEQPGWRQLWADVEKALARTRQENHRQGKVATKP
jgi:tetratricopeptide (TPR) repeat protein/serine/threonine protein kinase